MPTRKWKEELLVNTTVAVNQDQSSVTGLADGGYVVTWHDDGSINSLIRWQRYDAAGVKVGGEVTVASLDGEGDQTLPDVVQLSDGNLWFVNQDFDGPTDDDINGIVYSLTGTFLRTQSPQNSSGLQHQTPSIASLGVDGSVAVFYSPSDNGGDIKMTIFDAAGAVALNTAAVNTTTAGLQFAPVVASSTLSSYFTVVWEDANTQTVRAALFNETGDRYGAEFTVGSTDANGIATPVVKWLDNSRFVVAWQTAYHDITKFQIFQTYGEVTASPVAISNEIQVNTFGSAETPRIVALPNGGFVVAWDSFSSKVEKNHGIRLQAFDDAGGKIGGEILVNTTLAGHQVSPSIAALTDGRVVVSWTDTSQSGTQGTDIRSQIVDPRDGIIDGTVGADTLYGHDAVGDIITSFDGADTIYGLAGADVIYSGSGADKIYDGRGDDTVYAGADGDIIYGDLGDDQFFGGDGNDSIYSFGGADLMDGGAGTGDSVFYVNERSAVTINLVDQILNAGAAFGDTIVNIERIYGVVYFANNLTGDNNSNILVGGIRNDALNGGGGFDILRGGLGADTMTGGTSGDYFQYTSVAEGGDTITDWAAGDKFSFARAAFGNLTGANVAAINFLSVASGHAATTVDQKFIFDQATDQLWYDADGNAGGAAVMIADLSTNVNLLNTDLLLA
jgi:Ca2+-binding RTX toxin-like protein